MSYTAPDFADDVEGSVSNWGAPASTLPAHCAELAHLANRVDLALQDRGEMFKVLRDVAALLPSAGRMHPQDLYRLQTRVCEAIANAEMTYAGESEANAKLIAAAPEMAEALRELTAVARDWRDGINPLSVMQARMDDALTAARSALAKAGAT